VENAEGERRRVTSLELFFDLVFVFTITQITHLVEEVEGPADYGKAFLVLAVVWWMYAGYVWLTSNLDLTRTFSRLFLLAGMAGFFLIALSVPEGFGQDQLALGLAYVWVVAVHAVMFALKAGPGSAQAIGGIAPFNLAAGLAITLGAWLPAEWSWLGWAAAVGSFVLSTVLRRDRGFTIHPSHFAERHGLVLIVVLGESLVAIGNGAAGRVVDLYVGASVVGALALSAALWWAYFDRDEATAEQVLLAATGHQQTRMALMAYGYAYVVMLAGVIVLAAGLEVVLAHLGETNDTTAAINQGVGVALYLLGETVFRRLLGIEPGRLRPLAALAALITIPVGMTASGLIQMWLLLAIVVGTLVLEQRTVAWQHTTSK
jgi:low temperature requirement protein LtrA